MNKLDIENILLDYGNRLLDVANSKENPTLGELIEKPTQDLTQLLKEEVEQIIGEPERHSNGHKMVTSWTCDDCGLPTEAFTINDLRREQRARLNKTTEEK